MEHQGLFNNYKYCTVCKKPLPLSFEEDLCPGCKENMFFNEVKEYIRTNDVTEYDVADHFQIPLQRVKRWIREGRIEYKDKRLNAIYSLHCEKCGVPITFGTLCPKCAKQSGMSAYAPVSPSENGQFRFLEEPDSKRKK